MAQVSAKRKRCGVFKEEWTEEYYFVQHNGKPLCLICNKDLSETSFKVSNVSRHYLKEHVKNNHPACALTGQLRKNKILRLKQNLQAQSSVFTKRNDEVERAVQAGYAICQLMGTHMKPFSEGEFIKKILDTAAYYMIPDKKDVFSNISLSRRTTTRRIEDLNEDVKHQVISSCENFKYFSIAVDESTDAKDTAQLAVFVRGVDNNFNILEEFLQLMPLKDTTTGRDILDAVIKCLEEYKLDLSKLVSVTTDGAPAMVGVKKGFVALLQKHMATAGYENEIIKLHCILHQENLCAKNTQLTEVMSVVIKIVNKILSNSLNHRQFQQLLFEVNAQHTDLKYLCEVRWLSRGAMLESFFELRNEIREFLDKKGESFPQLSDPEWISKLAFLIDVTKYLNELNLSLQGKEHLVNHLHEIILSFEKRLRRWEKQLANRNFANFKLMKENPPSGISVQMAFMIGLREQFAERFVDIRSYQNEFKLFGTPFSTQPEEVHETIENELDDLHCDQLMKGAFRDLILSNRPKDETLVEFYKLYLQSSGKYPNIIEHAKRMSCIFGSTYVCEQLFSKMKFTKNKMRARITDDNFLQHCLASSGFKADIEKLSHGKQH